MVTGNWINEVDINNFGAAAAKGLKRSAVVSGGAEHPLVQEILRELYDKGKGNGIASWWPIPTTTPVWPYIPQSLKGRVWRSNNMAGQSLLTK